MSSFVVAVLMMTHASAGKDSPRTPAAKELVSAERVLIIAHRGDSQAAPENTLAAFAAAVKKAADLVELDYYHSSDGKQVGFHDKTLDRTTNAVKVLGRKKVRVDSQPLEVLRNLDAGSWFDARFRGQRVPTLEEALDVIQAGSVTLIEHKGGDAASCVALLRRKKLLDKVVVQSFDWEFVANCRKLAPNLVLAALGEKELTPARLHRIVALKVQAVGWRHTDLRKQDINAIHQHGLKAWVYTVNEQRDAAALIRNGIDGLITDKPGEMKALVGRQ